MSDKVQDSLLPSRSRISSALGTGTRSIFRTVAAGSLLLKKKLWVWPLAVAFVMVAIGGFVRNEIEYTLAEDLSSELQTMLAADVKALELWMASVETTAQTIAAGPHVIDPCEKLAELAAVPGAGQVDLLQSPALRQLRVELEPALVAYHLNGWLFINRDLEIIGALQNELVGTPLLTEDVEIVWQKALNGIAIVTPPVKSTTRLKSKDGQLKEGVPTMFAWAPVRNAGGAVIGALGLQIRPDLEFAQILRIASAGHTGQTYAFNREGLLLSESRFDEDLRNVGLLKDDEDSILNLQVRDPGIDMIKGGRPEQRRSEQPLTEMVQTAVQGTSGVRVDGYRDFRGVVVVGAWTWLDKYDFGVATEQDQAEAYRPVFLLRTVFWGLFGMLAVCALALFIFSLIIAQLNREARQAALNAKQLGQYSLDEKLGEGGMGVVYRAHHAMLLRPTAVKFLHLESTNEQSIARFEREVRLTSRLNHPNTIAIYDYGRTPEGIFYYAMEYLEGINLEDLVRRFGPQSEVRVIHLLQQVCGSLAEAHRVGLIHRDIKPANIMLTERGGVYDFVKLLDFGLVKAVDSERESRLTCAGSITGTPLYLSPEAIENPEDVDPRSDLYAVGAVGYWLLTGTSLFGGKSVLEIIQKHATTVPELPSDRLHRAVDPGLESLLMQCLAKDREDRPASAADLADALADLAAAPRWTDRDAEHWWLSHGLRAITIGNRSDTQESRLLATMVGESIADGDDFDTG